MKTLKTGILLLAVGAIALAAVAQQRSTPQARRGSAENSLVGINLFDTGQRLIARFGSPDEIQALTLGGVGAGPAGGGGGAGGGGRSEPGGAGGGPRGATPADVNQQNLPGEYGGFVGDPFDTGDAARQQGRMRVGDTGGSELQQRGGSGGGGATPAGGGAAGGRGGGGDAGSSGLVTFTRWVYRRGPSRYAFVLDRFNRVVQIEAVGMNDARVRTRRGVGFGNTFGTLIQRYNAPDGYEVAGDTLVVRYLQRDKVAFRLQRLDPKKPHVVTGIVVAAGR